MDGGDPTTPPMFACEKCGGEMYSEYYKRCTWHRVQNIGYSLDKKGLSEVVFLTQFFYQGIRGSIIIYVSANDCLYLQ